MGKYFEIVADEVMDWKFIKRDHLENTYLFYLDDLLVGQVSKLGKGWCCFDQFSAGKLVYGFRTRHDAAVYILSIARYEIKYCVMKQKVDEWYKSIKDKGESI